MQDPKLAWQALEHDERLSSSQSEIYLDLALRDWLDELVSAPNTEQVFSVLANSLMQNQQDPWLREFIEAPQSSVGNISLRDAISANYIGDSRAAQQKGEIAKQLFVKSGNLPGQLRSEFEIIYSLRRQSKGKECIHKAASLVSELRGHDYRWLHVQLEIEHSICEGQMYRFENASQLALESTILAKSSNYPSLILRSIALMASWHTLEGRLQQTWKTDEDGLETFWQGPYPEERGFQYYSDLELASEQAGFEYLAITLQREALSILETTSRLDYKSLTLFHLAVLEETIGQLDDAAKDFERSSTIFPSPSMNSALIVNREISLASVDTDKGKLAEARTRLESISSSIQKMSNLTEELPYHTTFAKLERAAGNVTEETSHLRKAVDLGNRMFSSLRTEKDRWQWDLQVGKDYRRFLELEIEEPHDPALALADWELYRAKRNSTDSASYEALIHNFVSGPALKEHISNFNNLSLLTFAVFPHWTVVWIADDRGTSEIRIPLASEILEEAVKDFYYLCADEYAPLQKVNESGGRLYNQILGPIQRALDPNRVLYIQADGVLNLISWSALTMPNGSYFGESFAIISVPGLPFRNTMQTVKPSAGMILVVNPGAVLFQREFFPVPPQAQQEVDTVRALFPANIYLNGQESTVEQVLHKLPQVFLFHFAGHAYSREYGGELILHGPKGANVLSASSLSDINLSGMDLVVLSACSTAGFESGLNSDPYGMVRSFLHAGSRRVIATRWDINSNKTTYLMQEFYKSFHHNNDALASLSISQKLLRGRGYGRPYYWASFEIFGTIN